MFILCLDDLFYHPVLSRTRLYECQTCWFRKTLWLFSVMIAHCFSFSRCGFVLVKVLEEQGPAVAEELVARPGERAHSPPPPATPPSVELLG